MTDHGGSTAVEPKKALAMHSYSSTSLTGLCAPMNFDQTVSAIPTEV